MLVVLLLLQGIVVEGKGSPTADIPRPEATEERIMTAATGQPSLVA